MSEPVAVEQIDGFGVSEDGQFAQMKFGTGPDGTPIIVTMPIAAVAEFYGHLGKLVGSLQAVGKIEAPQTGGQMIRRWKVGQSNDPAKAKWTALLFDEGTPEERLFLMGDVDALKLADAIEEKVFKGLSPEEQRKLVAEIEKGRRPKIILPGMH